MTDFLSRLSDLVAARAARVQPGDPSFASIDLAAHLFAAAIYLRERHGDARMDTIRPRAARGLEEALAVAAKLSRTDPVAAYVDACAALIGIDAFFGEDRLVTAGALPPETRLEPLPDGPRPALFGTVRHWIRPRNPWRAARGHREALCPEVNVYPPIPSENLDALGMIWDRGEIPELRPVRRRDLPHRPDSFRIALCPVFCRAHPRFAIHPDGDRFTIDPVHRHWDPAELAAYLATLAVHVEAADVQLLVLPELSVTEPARAQLAEILAGSRCMLGIVAGSYHVWHDGNAVPWNEAVFYLPHEVVWAHHKLGYFRVTARQIERFRALFTQPIPDLPPRVVEGIRRGSVLHFWDTRIGRIAILICADAIARESMIAAVERCSPDLLLLPSLSLETETFVRLAESLARRGISVLYVNAGTACSSVPGALAAFADLALPTPEAAPASRFRWSRGKSPEAYRFQQRTWVPASPTDVQILGDHDGIVFDLAAPLNWRDPGSRNVLADL